MDNLNEEVVQVEETVPKKEKRPKRRKRVTFKIIGSIILVQTLMLCVLFRVMANALTEDEYANTIENLKTMVLERSQIVDNYVQNAESLLTAYSRAGEVTNLLLDPLNEEVVANAQAYTEEFSADIIYM